MKTTPNDSNSHRVIELFAGVGGFRIALEKSGWKTVWSNQWEPSTKTQHASSCYVANFGHTGHSNEDIEVAVSRFENGEVQIPDAEMIVGGFPCQDYSVAKSLSSSAGLEGKKGVLWWQIHRLVSLRRPKVVFLENVDRLLKSPSKQRGRDFAIMLRTLGDLGYQIEWKVLNAADFGFSQRRIRVFIVAIRSDVAAEKGLNFEDFFSGGILSNAFVASSYSEENHFSLEQDPEEISNTFNLAGKSSPFLNSGVYADGVVLTAKGIYQTSNLDSGKLADALEPDSKVPPSYWIDSERLGEWEFLKGAKSLERVSKSGHVYNYSEGKMAFPDSLDKPSRTILTGEGGSSPSRFKHVVKTEGGFRRLLPIELERLNGFPDDWTKLDSAGNEISDAKRAFFMGNALVVGLVEIAGRAIKERVFS
jgi:DNA (cytosine-5)-methyltransferase 1